MRPVENLNTIYSQIFQRIRVSQNFRQISEVSSSQIFLLHLFGVSILQGLKGLGFTEKISVWLYHKVSHNILSFDTPTLYFNPNCCTNTIEACWSKSDWYQIVFACHRKQIQLYWSEFYCSPSCNHSLFWHILSRLITEFFSCLFKSHYLAEYSKIFKNILKYSRGQRLPATFLCVRRCTC